LEWAGQHVQDGAVFLQRFSDDGKQQVAGIDHSPPKINLKDYTYTWLDLGLVPSGLVDTINQSSINQIQLLAAHAQATVLLKMK
jgi:hypothetical protein